MVTKSLIAAFFAFYFCPSVISALISPSQEFLSTNPIIPGSMCLKKYNSAGDQSDRMSERAGGSGGRRSDPQQLLPSALKSQYHVCWDHVSKYNK